MSQKIFPSPAPHRSNIYRLLSLGFRYPTPLVFKTFQNGEFTCELENNISLLPHLNIPAIKKALFMDGVTFPGFEAKFVLTFDTGSPLPPCPPYEGMYRNESRTSVMLEISEFYRHFGLVMSQEEGKREVPDHISAELEFLHFLTFMEAQARVDSNPEFLKGYILAQKDFLKRHLLRWVPEFCDRLQNSGMPFYARLARLTSMFIACEHEFVTSKLQGFTEK